MVYHPEVVRWSLRSPPARPLGGQRSLVLVGAEHATAAGRLGRPRRRGWAAGLRLSLGSRFSPVVEFVRRRPPRPPARMHSLTRKCGGRSERKVGVG